MEHLPRDLAGTPSLAPGHVLAGRFRIVARLGEGAIGEVYEASDLELEEQVALKVLRPAIAGEAEVLHRFKREIQLARRVTHPSVCRTFDLFHHRGENGAGLVFITMQLLRGETLEERLQRGGPLQPAEALPLVTQIAEGLQAAHQAGVVHRDFKASNVLLAAGPDGVRAVVTDFGLAWSSSASPSVTRTGTLIGSPAYMAPEQVRGEAVTPATDVYALGIVVYEMVTGSLPFSADTAIGTAIKRLREPPTLPRVHAPGLDPHWEEVILRCLESDPAGRFATPLDVVRALEAPLAPRASGPVPGRLRSRSPGWTAVAGGAAIAFGLAAFFLAWRLRDAPRASAPPPPPAAPRPAVAVLGFENLSGDPGVAYVERSLVRMLPAELSAGERLRLIPGEQVSRARQDLGLAAGADLAPDTLRRLRSRLGADLLITGSYLAVREGAPGARRLRCDVAVQDARSGETLAAIRQDGTEQELLALIDSLGLSLRDRLEVDALDAAEQSAARAARPASARAARLYAEGLEHLSRFEALRATELLEQARDADPGNALIRADLAAAWSALGWAARAEEAAREAVRRSAGLGPEPRLRVEARFRETARQWDRASAIYRDLWTRFPDNLEDGLALARAQTLGGHPEEALGTAERLRGSPAAWSGDPRIDLAEAEAALRLSDLSRGLEAAARAERKGEELGAPLVVARALHFQGVGLRLLGRLPEAGDAGERAAGLFRRAGDLASAAEALNTAGAVLAHQGDLAGARRTFDEIAAIGRALGSEEIRGLGLSNFGMALSRQGDLAGAREQYTQALAIFRRTGSKTRAAQTSGNLALVHQRLGDRAAARALLAETAATLRDLGDRSSEARVLANLGMLSLEEGKLKEAWELSSRALELHRGIGEEAGIAEAQGIRGQVLALRGDLRGAERELKAAVDRLERLDAKLPAARQRIELALILAQAGRAPAGEELARRALEGLAETPSPADEVAARTVLAVALLEQGDVEGAAAEVERLAAPLAASGNPAQHLLAALTAAEVQAARGELRQAARALRTILAEAESSGLAPLILEIRLVLGDVETRSGDAAGRARLEEVERAAAQAGYVALERRAREALAAVAR